MLPNPLDPNFRKALKDAREAAKLSYSELARRAGIHAVMPSRYENSDHTNATLPSSHTLAKLNAVLFPNEAAADEATPIEQPLALVEADVGEIVAELKRRGATSVSISW